MARRRRGYYGRGKYRMTPKRRAALKRAQDISARKRRGKRIAVGAAVLGTAVIGGAVANHKIRGHSLGISTGKNKSVITGKTHPFLRYANIGGSRQASLGLGSRRISLNYDTRSRRVRGLAEHRSTVLGRRVEELRVKRGNNIDNSPNASNNPSLRFSETRVNPVGGAAKSRIIKPFVSDAPTYTRVRDPLSRKIMREGGRAIFGQRTEVM